MISEGNTVVNIRHASGNLTHTWVADRDYLLKSFTATVNCVLSTDPSWTTSNVATPAANITDQTILADAVNSQSQCFQLDIPIEKGRTYFVAFASAGMATLILAPN